MPAYISEINMEGGAASNFIEIAVPAGTDTSSFSIVIYNLDEEVVTTLSLGTVVTTFVGQDVYLIDDTNPAFIDILASQAIALVDNTGTALQFLSFEETITAVEGPANGETSTPIGVHGSSTSSLETTDGGSTYNVNTTENPGTIPCYAPGTLIETPDGPRAVETLHIGDLVNTLDHGPQPIRWMRSGDHPLEDAARDAKPVLIAASALGPDLPRQDMIVSPQHRILVGGHDQLEHWFPDEVFVPAKALTKLKGIRHMMGKSKITWIHFACERHEVVIANGSLSESLLLGPMVINAMPAADRRTVAALFGQPSDAKTALNGPPARPCLSVGETRKHLSKPQVSPASLLEQDIQTWRENAAQDRHRGADPYPQPAYIPLRQTG